MLKRIHVNQHVIRSNVRTRNVSPPLTIKTSRTNTKAHRVEILGPSELVYSPDRPLGCGARVWLETRASVHAFDADGGLLGVIS